MGNKGRLKDCGPGQERRERYLDPKGQDKSLEGIRLDVKEKVLAPAGTQAGDSQERQAVNSQIPARARRERQMRGSAAGARGDAPPRERLGRRGMERRGAVLSLVPVVWKQGLPKKP